MARETDGEASNASVVQALDADATVTLLERIRSGDQAALERLLARCLPPLQRWAHGRLPPYARDMLDTNDLVQETVIRALRHLGHFQATREGALQAYLRQALSNQIKDVIRNRLRRPRPSDLPEEVEDQAESPLDHAIGSENMARYEAALERLRAEDREAIIARLELQYSYEELAVALDKPTPNAARVAVLRAMQRLASEICLPETGR
jgi:RNA polymerase sigma factor (sigma-70 family)